MLRLTIASQDPEVSVLKVEGWLCGAEVSVLEQEGASALGRSRVLALDLSGLRAIDRRGLALLKGWPAARLELREPSVYLATRLSEQGLVCHHNRKGSEI